MSAKRNFKTITEWQKVITDWSKSKGWYDPHRNPHDAFILFHAEIAEMVEEYRDGHLIDSIYYNPDEDGKPTDKPEGVPVELIDTIIRVIDLAGCYSTDLEKDTKIGMFAHKVIGEGTHNSLNEMGGYSVEYMNRQKKNIVMDFTEHANFLHWWIGRVWYKVGSYGINVLISETLIALLDFGYQWGIDMDGVMEVKMKYNATRPHRHGGKVI